MVDNFASQAAADRSADIADSLQASETVELAAADIVAAQLPVASVAGTAAEHFVEQVVAESALETVVLKQSADRFAGNLQVRVVERIVVDIHSAQPPEP